MTMWLGNITEDATLDFHFTTALNGVPATLGGTPALSVYKDNSATQSTAGITLTVDFDSVTGLNQVRIDLSADAFYATGSNYSVIITTGTVSGNSVVGYVVATFAIEHRFNEVDVTAISGDATAANNLEADYDGTGYAKTNSTVGTVTTLTGHTAQTGDSFARLGAPAGASIAADIATVDGNVDAILVDTAEIGAAGAGLTAVPWNAAWDAEVQSEVNDGLVALGLDHLVSAAVVGADVTDNSIVAKLAASGATADWDTYVNTTDSLQAVRDRGDAAWATATTVDLNADQSGVTIGTVNTLTGHTAQTGDSFARLGAPAGASIAADIAGVMTKQMTESYAADGVAPTPAQALFAIMQQAGEFAISGSTITVKQIDGSTTAMTFTLDDATNPTSRTRAT